MDVDLITMDPEVARQKLDAYRQRLARQEDEEYRAVADALEHGVKGRALLDIDDVFRDCPRDEKWRPKLAIARADRRQVEFDWAARRTTATFNTAQPGYWRDSLAVRVDMGQEHGHVYGPGHWEGQSKHVGGFALVPMVPAEVRNEVKTDLRKCHILWEVEEWADERIGVRPDRDPYLLKHCGGSLYAVLAEWDLTDLERAVMKHRADR